MTYDPTKPLDNGFLADFPPEMREQLRSIVQDAIVNSGLLNGLKSGNAQGNIPVNNGTLNVGLNAEKLGGNLASAFSMSTHGHGVATGSSPGFMPETAVTKLATVATGAEVNQMAFSNVLVGDTTVQADSKTDTLELVAGTNIVLTPDAVNDKVTIGLTGKVPSAALADSATTAAACTGNSATATIASALPASTSNYGSVEITGIKGTYAGMHFPAIAKTWMGNAAGGSVSFGVYRDSGSWEFYFDNNGVLQEGTIPWSKVSGAPASLPANGGTATNANYVNNDSVNMRFHWSGQSGQPSWIWGGNAPGDMYVYNPSNFSVANANTIGGLTVDQIKSQASFDAGHSFAVNGYQKLSNGLITQWGSVAGIINTSGAVTFPIAFPSVCYAIVAHKSGYNGGDASLLRTTIPTVAGFNYNWDYWSSAGGGNAVKINYVAIGI